jgi:hypothetical protein
MLPDADTDEGGWALAISDFIPRTDDDGNPLPFPIPIFAFPPAVWRARRATVVPLRPNHWLGPFPTFGEAILGSAFAAGLSPRPSLTTAFGVSQLVLKFVPIGNSQAYSAMIGVDLLKRAVVTATIPFNPGVDSPATLADALTELQTVFNFLEAKADCELLSRPVSLKLEEPSAVDALDRLAFAVGAVWDWWPSPDKPADHLEAHLRPRLASPGLRQYVPTID